MTCTDFNGWPIYQRENGTEVMFFVSTVQGLFWYISSKPSSSIQPYMLRIMGSVGASCPGVDSALAPWYIISQVKSQIVLFLNIFADFVIWFRIFWTVIQLLVLPHVIVTH